MNFSTAIKLGFAGVVVAGIAVSCYQKRKVAKAKEEAFDLSIRKAQLTFKLVTMRDMSTHMGSRNMSASDIDFVADCIVAMTKDYNGWDLKMVTDALARVTIIFDAYFKMH